MAKQSQIPSHPLYPYKDWGTHTYARGCHKSSNDENVEPVGRDRSHEVGASDGDLISRNTARVQPCHGTQRGPRGGLKR